MSALTYGDFALLGMLEHTAHVMEEREQYGLLRYPQLLEAYTIMSQMTREMIEESDIPDEVDSDYYEQGTQAVWGLALEALEEQNLPQGSEYLISFYLNLIKSDLDRHNMEFKASFNTAVLINNSMLSMSQN